jgi:membrane-bound lytic murein transglycosylase D
MKSIRATLIYTLAFALLGCSYTLHNKYPPEHPPSPVLDLSPIQEPVAQREQPPRETPQPQLQEKSQETIQETPPPQADKPVHEKATPQEKKNYNTEYEVNSQVQFWVDRLSNKDRQEFQSALTRLDKIRPAMERIFERHGIPKELVYLCLVESNANPHAVSCSGAAGYWQFIPDTAKKYGLQVNKYVDERKNLEKSTQAAAQYLKHLYAIFGDWYLSIAAYNAGEGAVSRLMKGKGVYTFWDIKNSMAIKPETIDYVPRYIATVILAKNREAYGLRKSEPGPLPIASDKADSPGYLDDIAKASGGLKGSIAENDPDIITDTIPTSIKDAREKVRKNSRRSLKHGAGRQMDPSEESAPYVTHTIRKGETLYSLAKKHSTTVETIARANRLSLQQGLKVGKTIIIPESPTHIAMKKDVGGDHVHLVAKGETLKGISREHGIPVDEIIRANDIKDPGLIQPKTALVIPVAQSRHALKKAMQYKVKKGDTLWGISRQFDVSTMDIMRWNRLASAAEIKPGDKLTIYHQ